MCYNETYASPNLAGAAANNDNITGTEQAPFIGNRDYQFISLPFVYIKKNYLSFGGLIPFQLRQTGL